MKAFYVVATPIGNLEDITLRALAVLSSADLIVCEDTRVTHKLLQHYNIHTPMISYHARSTLSKVDAIIKVLKEGKSVALVSDAGTPTVSDPGSVLISKVKQEIPDLPVLAIPGASALTAALSVSGLPTAEFTFLGFLPHKKGRQTLLKEIAESKRAVVFYESPHRIMKTLEALSKLLEPSRVMSVGRELTKMFEETKSGTASEIEEYFKTHKDKQRGEFVIIIAPK